MKKTVQDTFIVYSQSRRMLLGLIVPLPSLLAFGKLADFSYGALPIVVTAMFAIVGLALGLTHETLTLDLATRSGAYETVFSGIFKRSRSFSFDSVVGCLVIDTVPKEYRDGQERSSGETIFHVSILYRESNGTLADQVEIDTFGKNEDAIAEAKDLTSKLGGKIYFKEDLETLIRQ